MYNIPPTIFDTGKAIIVDNIVDPQIILSIVFFTVLILGTYKCIKKQKKMYRIIWLNSILICLGLLAFSIMGTAKQYAQPVSIEKQITSKMYSMTNEKIKPFLEDDVITEYEYTKVQTILQKKSPNS